MCENNVKTEGGKKGKQEIMQELFGKKKKEFCTRQEGEKKNK
jgi:hypothetical protein